MTRYNGPDNQPPATWGDTYHSPMPAAIYPKKRKIWPWILGGLAVLLVLLCGFGALAIGSAANKAVQTIETSASPRPVFKTLPPALPVKPSANPSKAKSAEPVSSPAPAKTVKPLSVEQVNANEAAASYLTTQSFSRKSLIHQLEFEGYGSKAATTAVDSLHADWNEQAVLSAKSYLDGQSFSKKSLIHQLEFEGFTSVQAKYGVSKTGL